MRRKNNKLADAACNKFSDIVLNIVHFFLFFLFCPHNLLSHVAVLPRGLVASTWSQFSPLLAVHVYSLSVASEIRKPGWERSVTLDSLSVASEIRKPGWERSVTLDSLLIITGPQIWINVQL